MLSDSRKKRMLCVVLVLMNLFFSEYLVDSKLTNSEATLEGSNQCFCSSFELLIQYARKLVSNMQYGKGLRILCLCVLFLDKTVDTQVKISGHAFL